MRMTGTLRPTTPFLVLVLALALPSAGCGSDPLSGVLGVDPLAKAQYTVDKTERQDYAGKPRVSMTVTVPKGMAKEVLEAQMRHALYVAFKGSVVAPGAVRVRAYQDRVEDRPYTAALGVFSPDGRWTAPDPAAPIAGWKVSLSLRDEYLRGEDPPPLEAPAPVEAPKEVSPAMRALMTGLPTPAGEGAAGAAGAAGPAGDAAPQGAAATPGADEGVAPADVVTAELQVFALDHTGKPAAGTLRIDDRIVGKTPWKGRVAVGLRKVSVDWRFTAHDVVQGQENTVTIKLPAPGAKAQAHPVAPPGGTLAKAKIMQGIQADLSGLRSCYEKELKKDQFLQGTVVVGFTIDLDGSVAGASIESSEIDSRNVKRCIVGRVKRLRFAKPEGGSVQVAYPLTFKPKA